MKAEQGMVQHTVHHMVCSTSHWRLISLEKSPAPAQLKNSVNRLLLMKQDIWSHYSGIGHFPGEPYKFHLEPEHKPVIHAPRKDDAFKDEIKSFMELGILEEVKERTDWVDSYVIVEKDSGNNHSPNCPIKRKLRILGT